MNMTDTPIIDAAIRAGCKALDAAIGIDSDCRHPSCDCGNKKATMLAALRAALPWEPPAERLAATMQAGCIGGRANCRYPACGCETYPETVIAAYRADPIMLELYPEKFR
jgi:hypothetical protein